MKIHSRQYALGSIVDADEVSMNFNRQPDLKSRSMTVIVLIDKSDAGLTKNLKLET